MKTCLINLHNHLIDPKGNFYDDEKIEEYFSNFVKLDCAKVYAFTDHFDTIINLYRKDKLRDYKQKISQIQKRNNILVGFELDVKYENDENYKHLVCICGDIDTWYLKIKDYCEKSEQNIIRNFLFNDEPSDLFVKLLENTLCIPHFSKNDTKRNFNLSQIDLWNKSKKLPEIRCLEIAPRILNYHFFKSNKNLSDKFHCIVGSDRCNPLLTSFIFLNDYWKNSKDILSSIQGFFSQNEHKAALSYSLDPYEIYIVKIGQNINISKNCLIYGQRGSGKTYLCDELNDAFIGRDGVAKKSEIFYLKQGQYINEKEFKKTFGKITSKTLKKYIKCSDLFERYFEHIDIENLGSSKNEILNYKDTFIDEKVKRNIYMNENNNSIFLGDIEKKYPNFFKDDIKELCNSYKINKNFILKVNELITEFNEHKDVLIGDDDIIKKEIVDCISNLKKIKIKLLENLEKNYVNTKIKEYRKEIYKEIKEMLEKQWPYTFDFSFFSYFMLKKLIELRDSFFNSTKYIKYGCDNKYAFKCDLKYDEKNYFSVKCLSNPVLCILNSNKTVDNNYIKASEGQKREFLIIESLKEKNYNFFIFDEPEYAFDTTFLKNNLAKKINEILSDESKKCWIVTHSHVLWSETFGKLVKDVSYIKCNYSDGQYEYTQQLNNSNKGNSFMEIYEAGEELYSLRNKIYKRERKELK